MRLFCKAFVTPRLDDAPPKCLSPSISQHRRQVGLHRIGVRIVTRRSRRTRGGRRGRRRAHQVLEILTGRSVSRRVSGRPCDRSWRSGVRERSINGIRDRRAAQQAGQRVGTGPYHANRAECAKGDIGCHIPGRLVDRQRFSSEQACPSLHPRWLRAGLLPVDW